MACDDLTLGKVGKGRAQMQRAHWIYEVYYTITLFEASANTMTPYT